jgi:hypothetical protein
MLLDSAVIELRLAAMITDCKRDGKYRGGITLPAAC